jgi:hypothetical protein
MTSILLFCCAFLYAQPRITIGGMVVDQDSKKPIVYANVKVENTMRGTVSNIDGMFEITLDSSLYSIKFSCIGYESKMITFHKTDKSVMIEMAMKPILFNTVVIYPFPYTWEERFVLRAIDEKKRFKEKLQYYTASAYSKTSFYSIRSNKLFAMVEAVSNVAYQTPDLYKEKVLSLQMPPHMRNIPYQAIAINQDVDLYNDKIKVKSFSLISPLNDKALEYYDYKLNNQFLSGQDTILQIDLLPKSSHRPLFEGKLFFNKKTYQLVEARLNGNGSVKDAVADSLSLFIKYKTDTLFVLPLYTNSKLRMNFMGYNYRYIQENSYVNHTVNNPKDKPYIDVNQMISFEPNLTYQIGLNRESTFRMPLSEMEVEYQEVVDRVFRHAPLYRRVILFLFCDMMPLAFNQPASIGKIKINQLSNWYRFNKAEGHYIGLERQFVNDPMWGLYALGGYSFTQKDVYYNMKSRYKGLEFEIGNGITNLGGFDINRSSTTISALFSHLDDDHYYESTRYRMSQTIDFFQKLHTRMGIYFEEQKPVRRTTGFSVLKKDRIYNPNLFINPYNNHRVGIELNYLENKDIINNRTIIYHGNPFTNVSFGYDLQNRSVLKATENRSIYHLKIQRYQPIINPLAVDLKYVWHKQDKSDFPQEYNFISRVSTVFAIENELGFYSLNNYDYLVKDYIKLQGDVTFFNLPKLVTLRMSFGGLFSYIKPYGFNDIQNAPFATLDRAFWEYGCVIKGISIFNFYAISNTLNTKQIKFLFRMNF